MTALGLSYLVIDGITLIFISAVLVLAGMWPAVIFAAGMYLHGLWTGRVLGALTRKDSR